jgi:dolichol-phosphate mannosyltransferase
MKQNCICYFRVSIFSGQFDDDNSRDGIGELVEKIRIQNHHIHVLHYSGKLGLDIVYITGFKYAIQESYNAAFKMDADFSHDPSYPPDFLVN